MQSHFAQLRICSLLANGADFDAGSPSRAPGARPSWLLRVGSPVVASPKNDPRVDTKTNPKTATKTATKTDPYNSKGRAPEKSHSQWRFGTARAARVNLRKFSGEELLEESLAPREKSCVRGAGPHGPNARLNMRCVSARSWLQLKDGRVPSTDPYNSKGRAPRMTTWIVRKN